MQRPFTILLISMLTLFILACGEESNPAAKTDGDEPQQSVAETAPSTEIIEITDYRICWRRKKQSNHVKVPLSIGGNNLDVSVDNLASETKGTIPPGNGKVTLENDTWKLIQLESDIRRIEWTGNKGPAASEEVPAMLILWSNGVSKVGINDNRVDALKTGSQTKGDSLQFEVLFDGTDLNIYDENVLQTIQYDSIWLTITIPLSALGKG